jgi:hypothetical protein
MASNFWLKALAAADMLSAQRAELKRKGNFAQESAGKGEYEEDGIDLS